MILYQPSRSLHTFKKTHWVKLSHQFGSIYSDLFPPGTVTPNGGGEKSGNPIPKMAETIRLRIYFINCPDQCFTMELCFNNTNTTNPRYLGYHLPSLAFFLCRCVASSPCSAACSYRPGEPECDPTENGEMGACW